MGTAALITAAQYCGYRPASLKENFRAPQGLGPYHINRHTGRPWVKETEENDSWIYTAMDGYPDVTGQDILRGSIRTDRLRCPHSAEEIAAGIHCREAVEAALDWHYWKEGDQWMAERMNTGEIYPLAEWVNTIWPKVMGEYRQRQRV